MKGEGDMKKLMTLVCGAMLAAGILSGCGSQEKAVEPTTAEAAKETTQEILQRKLLKRRQSPSISVSGVYLLMRHFTDLE